MKEADISMVVAIEKECFSTPWSYDSFVLELTSPITFYLVAVDEKEMIVGYGGMWLVLDEANITNIGVAVDARGKGVASLILEGLISKAILIGIKEVNLEVRESNIGAYKLYSGFGFKETGRRKGYYQKPSEDALLLTLDLEMEV